jgi:hypothetical protein
MWKRENYHQILIDFDQLNIVNFSVLAVLDVCSERAALVSLL